MTDLFKAKDEQDDLKVTSVQQVDRPTWEGKAKLPGARKFPMDVENVQRPRRGHDY